MGTHILSEKGIIYFLAEDAFFQSSGMKGIQIIFFLISLTKHVLWIPIRRASVKSMSNEYHIWPNYCTVCLGFLK